MLNMYVYNIVILPLRGRLASLSLPMWERGLKLSPKDNKHGECRGRSPCGSVD